MHKYNKTRDLYFSERVTTAMNEIFNYPLTIVEAPMGYGKTIAVREHINFAGANILSQKVYNSSISGFWRHFCFLLDKIDSKCANSLIRLGFPNDSELMQEALRLIEEIQLPEKTVLFIDDYHHLNETQVGKFIEFLVVHEISGLHIVLTARFIDFPNMEELVLKEYIYHIRKDILELMPDDIIKYYSLCGVTINKSESEKLYSTTEGWISALYLLLINYKAEGRFMTSDSIYKLIDNAIYKPLAQDIKDFLLHICIFDNFSKSQAVFIWEHDDAEIFLDDLIKRNIFVNYDMSSNTYHIHNIFTDFLNSILSGKDADFKENLYKCAGNWCLKNHDYLAAIDFFHRIGDYKNMLLAVELDKGRSFFIEQKDLLVNCFDECPMEYKQDNLVALLVYAMMLVKFSEMSLFQKVCEEATLLIQKSDLDPINMSNFRGELELLKSFKHYNHIMKMSEHHKRACNLMNRPSVFLNTKGNWTFGSPSVLFMFYRESGKLEQEVNELKENMKYYYNLTNGHGMGSESLMEAEWHFNMGDFENAEIAVHKAQLQAKLNFQTSIVISALFLVARLNLIKGNYSQALNLFNQMREEVEMSKVYSLVHTIEMCVSYINACLGQNHKIPEWLTDCDFESNRSLFQTRAFSNIIRGRVLLIKGEYLKLLGNADQFSAVSSFYPNTLAMIYNLIYVAAAKDSIFRKTEAVEALKKALDLAITDQVYMPFVENCDFIKSIFDELLHHDVYREHVNRILELYEPYHNSIDQIIKEHFTVNKPKLTKREKEIAQLAAKGYSNKMISERLFISPNTVKTQLKSVFEKIGINSRFLLKQYFEDSSNI